MKNIYELIGIIAGIGGVGGLINCAVSGEFHPPSFDALAKVWRPGWLGNLFVGCAAAVVIWGIYGPFASFDLASSEPFVAHLTLAQLVTSLVVGMGGGRILTLEAQKLILKSEKAAEREAKISLAEILKNKLT